ncbi:MAG TPA: DUF1287 domain-containing protein [Pseudobacteroides sp.]|uniref:DUF1287 domain-containing protein n=1 Tax=Pseudobacteroides sp. TaxID=1968840 RepID=UPI002F94CB1C
MRKLIISGVLCISLAAIGVSIFSYYNYHNPLYYIRNPISVENLKFDMDKDSDGVNDLDDIVEGARKEITNNTKYKDGYFDGGYPPPSEGVCTDVIWRSLKNAGYDLKALMDIDIRKNLKDYANRITKPDPNIDFRRVKNQLVFFRKYAKSLTLDVIPYDKENLSNWQRGDIVILNTPETDHVAVISDKRRKDGVPYILHNASTYAMEENLLLKWSKKKYIIGHFRFPKN